MKVEIKHGWTGSLIFECDADSMRVAVEMAVEKKVSLADANLAGANLAVANLALANLARANLAGANLARAKEIASKDLEQFFQIPQEGELIVWGKKNGILVKMLVPRDSKRTGNLINRKCRAEFIEVLAVEGAEVVVVKNAYAATEYRAGQVVHAHAWDDNGFIDCAPGIHFFLTRKEAEMWGN